MDNLLCVATYLVSDNCATTIELLRSKLTNALQNDGVVPAFSYNLSLEMRRTVGLGMFFDLCETIVDGELHLPIGRKRKWIR